MSKKGGRGGHLQCKNIHCKFTQVSAYLRTFAKKKAQCNFQKVTGVGSRPFGDFTKKHPYLGIEASLINEGITNAPHLRIYPRICIHIAISIGICICLDLQHHSHLHQEQLSLFPIFIVVNSTVGQGHRIAESIKVLSPERESVKSSMFKPSHVTSLTLSTTTT